jgi:hypothetical protein
LLDGIPLGRFASTWDIANAILFLGSAESDFITGQQIVVDGGFSLKGGVGNSLACPMSRTGQSRAAKQGSLGAGRPSE